uniref:Interferon n=1 Tax=Paralichthys olivaceus TaxID=8255 RepID=Q91278_PAROL|nr:interferon [Paralichthys olivaceus]
MIRSTNSNKSDILMNCHHLIIRYDDNSAPSGGSLFRKMIMLLKLLKLITFGQLRVVELFVKSNTSKTSTVLSIDGSNLISLLDAPKDILDKPSCNSFQLDLLLASSAWTLLTARLLNYPYPAVLLSAGVASVVLVQVP